MTWLRAALLALTVEFLKDPLVRLFRGERPMAKARKTSVKKRAAKKLGAQAAPTRETKKAARKFGARTAKSKG